jgi:hypothetical protein
MLSQMIVNILNLLESIWSPLLILQVTFLDTGWTPPIYLDLYVPLSLALSVLLVVDLLMRMLGEWNSHLVGMLFSGVLLAAILVLVAEASLPFPSIYYAYVGVLLTFAALLVNAQAWRNSGNQGISLPMRPD